MLIHLCRYPVIVCSHSALSDGSRLSTRAMSVSDRSEADSAAKAGRAVERNDDTEEEQDMVPSKGVGPNQRRGIAGEEGGKLSFRYFLSFSSKWIKIDSCRFLLFSF